MTDITDKSVNKEMVKNQACFSKLTDAELDILASLFVEKEIKAGETIVTEGDPVDSVYLITNGMADVRHISVQDGVNQITSLAKLHAGDAIGLNETGFYSISGIRTATVVADTDMSLLKLSMAAFHGFALSYPHVNEIMRKNAETLVDDMKS